MLLNAKDQTISRWQCNDIWSYLCNIYPGCMELICKVRTNVKMKHVTSENTYYLTLRKYLIPNTCGWMQKTRLYQEDDDMKQVTSENTLYLILVVECKRLDHIKMTMIWRRDFRKYLIPNTFWSNAKDQTLSRRRWKWSMWLQKYLIPNTCVWM